MRKLSVRQILNRIKLSSRDIDEKEFVRQMKEKVKKDPAVIEKFEEYGISTDSIDGVHVEFEDLDVSAKTKNKKIYLNRKMLDPKSGIDDPTHYLAHELTHWLQQTSGNTKGHEVKDYLSKPTEEEAFKVQVDFKERHEGKGEAEEYVEELLDHHDKDGKERQKIKKKLME